MDLFSNYQLYDITPIINRDLAVFPGDTPFSRHESMGFSQGDHLVLSYINTTVHLGAHTDAPNHYHPQGKSIEHADLATYMGLAQVIEVDLPRGRRIEVEHIKSPIQAPRVLFKTNSFPDPYLWNDDFNGLSPATIEFLHQGKVKLVGIDTPSVDLAQDKELITHNTIYQKDIRILEGIVLGQVEPGLYQLVALPLPLAKCDASPVRAVLLGDKK